MIEDFAANGPCCLGNRCGTYHLKNPTTEALCTYCFPHVVQLAFFFFFRDVWCGRFLGGTWVCDVGLFSGQRFFVFTVLCDGLPLCTMYLGQLSCRILLGHILLACVVVDVVSDALN